MDDKLIERFADNYGWWADRQAATQAKLTNKSIKDTEKQLAKYYNSSMTKIFGQFEQTYHKLLLTIDEGREPTPADLYKLDKYWQMQNQLHQELQKLGDKTNNLLRDMFIEQYKGIYESVAIVDGTFFAEIDRATAEQMINQIWCADGKTWSNRIWTNTDKLKEALNDGLIDCVLTGKQPRELKEILQYQFKVSYNRADTVVRTEMAHIQTQAARERYKDAGITEVQVWADKDERRCEICGKLHKTKYPIGSQMPIPAHPKCRCCIIPVVE